MEWERVVRECERDPIEAFGPRSANPSRKCLRRDLAMVQIHGRWSRLMVFLCNDSLMCASTTRNTENLLRPLYFFSLAGARISSSNFDDEDSECVHLSVIDHCNTDASEPSSDATNIVELVLCLMTDDAEEREGWLLQLSTVLAQQISHFTPAESQEITQLSLIEDSVSTLLVVPLEHTSTHVWAGTTSGTVRVWESVNKTFLRDVRVHAGKVTAMIFVDGFVWTGCASGSTGHIAVWSASNSRFSDAIISPDGPVRSLCVCGDSIVASCSDSGVCLWDARSHVFLGHVDVLHHRCVRSILGVGPTLWCASDQSLCLLRLPSVLLSSTATATAPATHSASTRGAVRAERGVGGAEQQQLIVSCDDEPLHIGHQHHLVDGLVLGVGVVWGLTAVGAVAAWHQRTLTVVHVLNSGVVARTLGLVSGGGVCVGNQNGAVDFWTFQDGGGVGLDDSATTDALALSGGYTLATTVNAHQGPCTALAVVNFDCDNGGEVWSASDIGTEPMRVWSTSSACLAVKEPDFTRREQSMSPTASGPVPPLPLAVLSPTSTNFSAQSTCERSTTTPTANTTAASTSAATTGPNNGPGTNAAAPGLTATTAGPTTARSPDSMATAATTTEATDTILACPTATSPPTTATVPTAPPTTTTTTTPTNTSRTTSTEPATASTTTGTADASSLNSATTNASSSASSGSGAARDDRNSGTLAPTTPALPLGPDVPPLPHHTSEGSAAASGDGATTTTTPALPLGPAVPPPPHHTSEAPAAASGDGATTPTTPAVPVDPDFPACVLLPKPGSERGSAVGPFRDCQRVWELCTCQVPSGVDSGWVQIPMPANGSIHRISGSCGCGSAVGVNAAGALYSWGGQPKTKPFLSLLNDVPTLDGTSAFGSTEGFVCVATGGTMYCWKPAADTDPPSTTREAQSITSFPAFLDAAHVVVQVACGRSHVALLTDFCQVYTFGGEEAASVGALGQGKDFEPSIHPALVFALSGEAVSSVACGGRHTVAVTDTSVFTFGWNASGQLGRGHLNDDGAALAVPSLTGLGVVHACAGFNFTMVLTCGGQVLMFGGGESGQMGIDSIEDQLIPLTVSSLIPHSVWQIGCGMNFAAALTDDGALYVWGGGVANLPIAVSHAPIQHAASLACSAFSISVLTLRVLPTSTGVSSDVASGVARASRSPSTADIAVPPVLRAVSVEWMALRKKLLVEMVGGAKAYLRRLQMLRSVYIDPVLRSASDAPTKASSKEVRAIFTLLFGKTLKNVTADAAFFAAEVYSMLRKCSSGSVAQRLPFSLSSATSGEDERFFTSSSSPTSSGDAGLTALSGGDGAETSSHSTKTSSGGAERDDSSRDSELAAHALLGASRGLGSHLPEDSAVPSPSRDSSRDLSDSSACGGGGDEGRSGHVDVDSGYEWLPTVLALPADEVVGLLVRLLDSAASYAHTYMQVVWALRCCRRRRSGLRRQIHQQASMPSLFWKGGSGGKDLIPPFDELLAEPLYRVRECHALLHRLCALGAASEREAIAFKTALDVCTAFAREVDVGLADAKVEHEWSDLCSRFPYMRELRNASRYLMKCGLLMDATPSEFVVRDSPAGLNRPVGHVLGGGVRKAGEWQSALSRRNERNVSILGGEHDSSLSTTSTSSTPNSATPTSASLSGGGKLDDEGGSAGGGCSEPDSSWAMMDAIESMRMDGPGPESPESPRKGMNDAYKRIYVMLLPDLLVLSRGKKLLRILPLRVLFVIHQSEHLAVTGVAHPKLTLQLVSPDSSFVLQASSEEEKAQWVSAISARVFECVWRGGECSERPGCGFRPDDVSLRGGTSGGPSRPSTAMVHYLRWVSHEYPDGGSYEGSWILGLREGYGHYRSSSFTYSGNWKADAPHGYGRWASLVGGVEMDVYEGSWLSGRRHGRGKAIYKGDSGRQGEYDGEWDDGLRHGFGTRIWSGGNAGHQYRGQWKHDVMHGLGEFVWGNGDRYVGPWENGKRHGTHGILTDQDGTFDGGWVEGRKHGYGMLYYDNVRLQGLWVNGAIQGRAVCHLPNGDQIIGEWSETAGGSTVVKNGVYIRHRRGNDAGDRHSKWQVIFGQHTYESFDSTELLLFRRFLAGGIDSDAHRDILHHLTMSLRDHTHTLGGMVQSFVSLFHVNFQERRHHSEDPTSSQARSAARMSCLTSSTPSTPRSSSSTTTMASNTSRRSSKSIANGASASTPRGSPSTRSSSFSDLLHGARPLATGARAQNEQMAADATSDIHTFTDYLHSLVVSALGRFASTEVELVGDGIRSCIQDVLLAACIVPLTRTIHLHLRDHDEAITKAYSRLASSTLALQTTDSTVLCPICEATFTITLKREVPTCPHCRRFLFVVSHRRFLLSGPSKDLYSQPIRRLSQIRDCVHVSAKVQVLVDVFRLITEVVQSVNNVRCFIEVDNLIPVTALVLVRAEVPSFGSELVLIEEFIDDSCSLGEVGCCLANLQAAVSYLLSIDPA